MRYLTSIIVEDEDHCIEQLEGILAGISNITIKGTANNVEDAVRLIKTHKPNIVFLDVEIEGGNAFDVIEKVQPLNFKIIFTTAHSGYAIKAIKLSALDYILKPFGIEDIESAIIRAQNEVNFKAKCEQLIENRHTTTPNEKKIALCELECIHYIQVKDIIYCKSDKSYTTFYISDGSEVTVSEGLKYYEEEVLSGFGFFRIHNSYLINLSHVHKYIKSYGGSVIMSNGSQILVSRRRKNILLQKLREK